LKLATTTKTKLTKVRDEPINNRHDRLGTYPLGCQNNTSRMTN